MLAIGEVLPDGDVSKNVESFMNTKKYLVVSPHESEFPKPITFKKGDMLIVGEKYSGAEDWDNWFLCSASGQEPGWVPGLVLDQHGDLTGMALEDYTARELNVLEGEQLTGIRTLNGWLWRTKHASTKSGWVPLENLKEVVE